MRKILSLLLIFLILISLSGCSGNSKSEEELKAEIKAEMEAEAKLKEELKEEIKAEMEQGKGNSQASNIDMKDMDAIYEFVKKDIVDISRENFNTWEVSYFDITGNGTDEAVLVSRYGVDWYEKMEIISGDSGQYKRIPSDIPLAKNGDVPVFDEGFLTVLSATSGSGMLMSYMHFYVYNGSEMVKVLDELLVEQRIAFPDADFEEKAEIEGSMKDFTYTVTKHDYKTGKETIEAKEQYTYNPNTMSFDVKSLGKTAPSGSQGSTSQPKLSGFNDENIRGEQVNYSNYTAVIVPYYPEDGLHINALSEIPVGNPGGPILSFAVFGNVEELTITLVDDAYATEQESSFGAVKNAIFNIEPKLPHDRSYYRIEGKVLQSNGSYTDIRFGLDDMRGPSENQIIFVK